MFFLSFFYLLLGLLGIVFEISNCFILRLVIWFCFFGEKESWVLRFGDWMVLLRSLIWIRYVMNLLIYLGDIMCWVNWWIICLLLIWLWLNWMLILLFLMNLNYLEFCLVINLLNKNRLNWIGNLKIENWNNVRNFGVGCCWGYWGYWCVRCLL